MTHTEVIQYLHEAQTKIDEAFGETLHPQVWEPLQFLEEPLRIFVLNYV